MSVTTNELCVYQVLDGQIHEFVFFEDSHEALAKGMSIVETIYQQFAGDNRLRLLCDFAQSGMPPMRYAIRLIQELDRRYPNRPLLRVAFLHSPGPLVKIALSLMQVIQRDDKRRFFDVDERQQAIAWLLKED